MRTSSMCAIRKAYHIWRYGSTNCRFTNLCFPKDEVANITSGYGYSVVHSPKSSKLVLSCHDSTLGMTHHEERGRELGGGGISTKILSLPGNSLGVKQVSCGRNHFMVLATNGTVYSYGSNCFGQCALDMDFTYVSSVTHVESLQRLISQVCCGLDHTLFLDESGSVTACGWAADGQTGAGLHESVSMPTPVSIPNDQGVVKLCTGADSCFAITDNSKVYGWGNNEYGQLGIASDRKQVAVPTEINLSELDGSLVSMATGGVFTAYLTSTGSIFYTGCGLERSTTKQQNLTHLFSVPRPISAETKLSAGLHYLTLKIDHKDPFAYLWGSYHTHKVTHTPRQDRVPYKIPLNAADSYCSGFVTIDALLS